MRLEDLPIDPSRRIWRGQHDDAPLSSVTPRAKHALTIAAELHATGGVAYVPPVGGKGGRHHQTGRCETEFEYAYRTGEKSRAYIAKRRARLRAALEAAKPPKPSDRDILRQRRAQRKAALTSEVA